MASLKEKATKKKSSSLGSKVKESSKLPAANNGGVPPEQEDPQPNITTPVFNAAPPLPPALAFINYIATVPGVRKRERGY